MSLLQALTQLAALLAGITALVYLTGGIVLSLRLAIEHLPWTDVVSHLPREFLLSVGAGQVLLPTLLVTAVYLLYRLLRGDRCEAPALKRSRDGLRAVFGTVLLNVIWITVFSLVPLMAVFLYRYLRADYQPSTMRAVIAIGFLLFAAYGIHEVRAVLTDRYRRPRDWRSPKAIGVMAGFYCLAAVPAMVMGAAAIALNEAKVCTVEGAEERGVLVGQSSDKVYLGELRDQNRRLAIYPMARVDELFIGPRARKAGCEVKPVESGTGPRKDGSG